MSCPSCGLTVPEGARFCPHCGKSQVIAVEERRLVTVLFADIVGFTTISQHLDPEQVKRLVDSTFKQLGQDIQRFGGKVDKIIGDELVALFGAPVAHSDDAERAVRAALAMKDTAARLSDGGETLQLRIGITTGDVLVGATVIGGDYTAMGDTMNLASRLEQIAEPGQIIVGPATQAASAGAILYRPKGDVSPRGRSGKVNIFEAVRAAGPPGTRRLHSRPFVGRSHELGVLDALGKLAVEANRAQVALLQGEAGVGKNRIAKEAAQEQHRKRKAVVLEGRCAPYGEANVWWPIAQALRSALSVGGDASVDEARAIIHAWLVANGVHLNHERMTIALLHTLGYRTPLRGGDREYNRAEVVFGVSTLLAAKLKSTPIVFVLSDADWASAAVWVLVERVLKDLADQPLMVIITARDISLPPGLQSGDFGSLTFSVHPLDPAATGELLANLGVHLSTRNAERLVERSGGNPFFMEELVALIVRKSIDGSGLTDDELVDQLMTASVEELPDTLRGTIAARLDGLEASVKQLLQDAAVLGRAGPVAGLVALAKETRGVADISETLQALVEEDLLEVLDGRYRFRSDLVRDVAYATITKTTRAILHSQIATFIEKDTTEPVRNSVVAMIADHYSRSAGLVAEMAYVKGIDRPSVTAKAIYWLGEAGFRALESDPPSAESWFSSGIELAADDETKAMMYFGRAQARLEVGALRSAREDLEQLESFNETDAVLRARSLLVQGNLERRSRNLVEAAAILREAADRLAALGEFAEQALALRLLGLTELARNNRVLARRALEASQRVAASINDRRAEAWAFQSLAWQAFRSGHVDEASGFVAKASELFTELGDASGLTWTKGVEAWVLFHNGALAEAEELVAEVLPGTAQRGDPWAEGITSVLSASIHLWSGRPDRALEAADRALAAAARADDITLAVQARAVQGRAHISLANITDGLKSLEQSFALAEHQGDNDSRRLAAGANCAAGARLGRPRSVLMWAARFDQVHAQPDVVGESEIVVSVSLALLQLGQVLEAIQELEWIDSSLPRVSRVSGDAVAALVLVANNEIAEAQRRIDHVLSVEATYLDRFRAWIALAALHYRQGDLDRAESVLGDAINEVDTTRDRITGPLARLLRGVCGFEPLDVAEQRCREMGVDPVGWLTAFRAMVGAAAEEPSQQI